MLVFRGLLEIPFLQSRKAKKSYLSLPLPRRDIVVERLVLQPGIHLRATIEGPANRGDTQLAAKGHEHLHKIQMWKL